jgi:hypothetical protein
MPDHAGWSELLFSPASSCVILQLQFCFVFSSHSKVGQFGFELEISSGIHYLPSFGRWLITPPLLSAFAACLVFVWWCIYLLSLTPFSRTGLAFHPHPAVSVRLQFGFECCPLPLEFSSGFHYLCCFGRWFVTQLLLSAFAALPMFIHWEFCAESLAPCPTPFSRAVSRFSPSPHYWC